MNEQNVETYAAKQTRWREYLRKFWMVYVAVLSVLVLWNFYRWSQNGGNLDNAFLHLAMIFIGLGNIFMNRNKILQFVFIGLGAVFSVIFVAILANR